MAIRAFLFIVSFLFTTLFFSSAEARKILFSPIPTSPKETLIANYYPLIRYLQEKTKLPIEFHYERGYRELVSAFKEGKIAIVTLGSLPYYILRNEFPHAKPILYFNESDGSVRYTCVLFTSFDGPKSPRELKGKLALPQRTSTCGYFSAGIILSKYGKSIERLGYVHFDTHSAVVEAVLKGKFQAGVVKKDVAEQYRGFGIKILDESPMWPAFALIVNTKVLTAEEIEKIKSALLSISKEEAKSLVIGKFGFTEAHDKDFEIIKKYEKFIPSI